ncbi:unnamed protein product [Peniophora sp. CBMAI 1063]|nr:unnamed protein product [Peniophora sp. CBMAI 1063]
MNRSTRLSATGEVADRVSAFQRAYENVREIVQYSILQTMSTWKEDWAYEGQAVLGKDVGKTYSVAPEGLKLAIDWQLQWDSPALIQSDAVYRALEYHRRMEAGCHEDHSIVCTYSAWLRHNEGLPAKPPSRGELASAYESAPDSLKTAMCYVLELGLTYPVESLRDVDDHKACVHDIVSWQKARVHRWESGVFDDDVN